MNLSDNSNLNRVAVIGIKLTEGRSDKKSKRVLKMGALADGKYNFRFTGGKSYAINGFTLLMYWR